MRYPDLEIDLLRCFATVATEGGFTAGGNALGLTQSAVSLKVKRLEDLLRSRVFERTSRSLALTPEGETLLGYARRILALNDEAVRRMLRPPVSGRLRLGVADHFVPNQLPGILARFARAYPEVKLEVEVGRSHELRRAAEQGLLDLVIGKRRDGETAGSRIWSEPLVWVAASGWAMLDGEPVPLATLPPGCLLRDRATGALARAGLAAEIVYTSSSLLGVMAAVEAGLAVTVLGKSSVRDGLFSVENGLPELGEVEMAVFGDGGGQMALVEPLVGFIRESLEAGVARAG